MFRRKQGNAAEKSDHDPVFEAKVRRFEQTHAALSEVHAAIDTFTRALAVMCASARAVAGGLEKLCAHDDDPQQLKDVVSTFSKVHEAIDEGIRAPVRKATNDIVLRDIGVLLSRMPPVLKKIDIRKALVSDFDASNERLRIEMARDPSGAAPETTKWTNRVETVSKSINQTTQDITSDMDQVDLERPVVLRPVSALVGCELFLFGRAADLLQGLAAKLPLSCTSLAVLATEVPRPDPKMFRNLTVSLPTAGAVSRGVSSSNASPTGASSKQFANNSGGGGGGGGNSPSNAVFTAALQSSGRSGGGGGNSGAFVVGNAAFEPDNHSSAHGGAAAAAAGAAGTPAANSAFDSSFEALDASFANPGFSGEAGFANFDSPPPGAAFGKAPNVQRFGGANIAGNLNSAAAAAADAEPPFGRPPPLPPRGPLNDDLLSL